MGPLPLKCGKKASRRSLTKGPQERLRASAYSE